MLLRELLNDSIPIEIGQIVKDKMVGEGIKKTQAFYTQLTAHEFM